MFFNRKKRLAEKAAKKQLVEDLRKYRNVLISLKLLDREATRLYNEMHQEYFSDIFNITKFIKDKDYEVIKNSPSDLIIFYNKLSDQPQFVKRDDFNRKYYTLPIHVGTVAKKIRQQRTQGSLDGHGSMNIEHYGRYMDASGGGNIHGSLDTIDEYILIVRFENVYTSVRVSVNLFYLAEEGQDLYMCYNDFNLQDCCTQKYDIDEIQKASIRVAEMTKIRSDIEKYTTELNELTDRIPYEKATQVQEELKFYYGA